MYIKSLLILLVTLGICYFARPVISYAADCQVIYGGGQTCGSEGDLLVNKKILNPKTNALADNLGIEDTRFEPGNLVTFKIDITNKSDSPIKKVVVKDIFPQYVTFSSGPGIFDDNTKNLTFTIDELKSQETKTTTIVGKIASASQLSAERDIVCVVNQVIVSSNESENKDNVQFCIEKKTTSKGGFPIVTPTSLSATPSTGGELLTLISLFPIGTAGWLLRKYNYKKN